MNVFARVEPIPALGPARWRELANRVVVVQSPDGDAGVSRECADGDVLHSDIS